MDLEHLNNYKYLELQGNFVKNRESEHREFKLIFDTKELPKYAKIMASFANRDGGVLFFGIKDSPRELIGIKNNHLPTELTIANFLKEYFEPAITFDFETKQINEKLILLITTHSNIHKPTICKKEKKVTVDEKMDEILRTGAIYYRYSSATEEIKYAELKKILDDQLNHNFQALVQNITILHEVGLDKAAISSAVDLCGENTAASVFLANETVNNINWIKKGSLTTEEKKGGNAYFVEKQIELKHGIVSVPDYKKSYPLTKTSLMKSVEVNSGFIDAVIWKCNINHPDLYIQIPHGKSKLHKYSEKAKIMILDELPLQMEPLLRKAKLKSIKEEYLNQSITNPSY